MKILSTFFSALTFLAITLTACNSKAQNSKQATNTPNNGNIEVIQFHSEHRCMTCNKIETLTKETLKNFPDVSFTLVNVDDKKNKKKAEQFEASGTALFLYNTKTGKKKDLTDFAFMNAGNQEKFIIGLKKEMNQFGK